MRLLQKTTRYNLLITFLLLILSGFQLYYFLKQEIIEEMQEQLEFQVNDIHAYLTLGQPIQYPLVNVTRVADDLLPSSTFGDTLLLDPVQKKIEDYYYLVSIKKNTRGNYRVIAMTNHIGWTQYSSAILKQLLFTALYMVLLIVLVNYIFNKKIWRPFFTNLSRLQQFSVTSDQPLQLEDSRITEFIGLKTALQDLADRSRKEYLALREFTEDAAHEMQTPLGIIQSQLDKISQMEVSEDMSSSIVQAKLGVQRLRRLNKSLLLLAKLDNNAYPEKSELFLDQLLGKQLQALEELFSSRDLRPDVDVRLMVITANVFLVETLLTNLLSNVIKYTPTGSRVAISLYSGELRIVNPGAPLDFPETHLFQRFQGNARNADSTGLGLAIVQQICLLNGWKISYSYTSGQHEFVIAF